MMISPIATLLAPHPPLRGEPPAARGDGGLSFTDGPSAAHPPLRGYLSPAGRGEERLLRAHRNAPTPVLRGGPLHHYFIAACWACPMLNSLYHGGVPRFALLAPPQRAARCPHCVRMCLPMPSSLRRGSARSPDGAEPAKPARLNPEPPAPLARLIPYCAVPPSRQGSSMAPLHPRYRAQAALPALKDWMPVLNAVAVRCPRHFIAGQ